MTIRTLKGSDLEPLHRLYSRLAARIANHPRVSLEQFAAELKGFGAGRMEQRTAGMPRRALVATQKGAPVAFASTAVCTEGFWELAAGQGLLRFVFAAPTEQEAAVELIRRATAKIRADGGERPAACVYCGGPRFHNWGCAMVPSAWPWIGHWLSLAGYAPAGSEIRMRRGDPRGAVLAGEEALANANPKYRDEQIRCHKALDRAYRLLKDDARARRHRARAGELGRAGGQ